MCSFNEILCSNKPSIKKIVNINFNHCKNYLEVHFVPQFSYINKKKVQKET